LTPNRPWKWSLSWLALLGPSFFLSYGFANHVTSRRAHVPAFAFGWERWVPFLPWMIVPYWSSDLLYPISLFVCSTRRELNVHVKRLAAVQIISVLCFLVFPLRCLYVRPQTNGLFGQLFGVLNGFDKPFNQAPSLHVGLALILWSRFSQHLRGFWRMAIGGWLLLVALSAITTWQHQFIDLPAGLLVGFLAIALVPEEGAGEILDRRGRIATFYLSGSVLCLAISFKMRGPGWIILWPAAALLFVAIAYAADWPGAFQKRHGRIHPIVAAIIAPYSVAAWMNSRWWTRRAPDAQEVVDGIWLGRAPGWFDRDVKNFGSIVDVTAELQIRIAGTVYRGVPMLDLLMPSPRQLGEAVAAIEELGPHRPTLVCCALGLSRSPMAIAAWMVSTGRAVSMQEATRMIRLRCPRILEIRERHAGGV
jgi:hypothetical protein